MALRLSGFPSALFPGKAQQQLQQKELPNSFLCPSSQIKTPLFLSFSPLTQTPNTNRTLLFPISSATQQDASPPPSSISPPTLQDPSTDSQQKQQQQEPIPDRTRLVAQNIPWTSTAEDIRNLFERHGTVTDVEMYMYNKVKNRGLAFVSMSSEEEALAAIENLDSHEFDGRVIKVEFSKSLKKKQPPPIDLENAYHLFVGNLDWNTTSSDLREFFGGENGNLLRAEVVYHTSPRSPAGYGFVAFRSLEEVAAAVAKYDGKLLMGRSVRLQLSKKSSARYERESKGKRFEENLSR